MAKRFTDSLKYKKHFFRSLPGAYKLFYDFLYHDCDHAGIWIVDIETAQIFVGKDMPIERDRALHLFNTDEIRIVPFDGGKKWFIPLFIKFQYGHLSEKNRAHTAVINILKKYNLIDENLLPIERICAFSNSPKPLSEKPKGDKDMDMEQDMDMDMDEEQEGGVGDFDPKLLLPQMQALWVASFPKYTANRQKDFPALKTIVSFICADAGLKKPYGDVDMEIKVLNTFQLIADQVNREPFWVNKPLSAISNNIQEFYNKIKNPINGAGKKPIVNGKHAAATREEINKIRSERFGGGG